MMIILHFFSEIKVFLFFLFLMRCHIVYFINVFNCIPSLNCSSHCVNFFFSTTDRLCVAIALILLSILLYYRDISLIPRSTMPVNVIMLLWSLITLYSYVMFQTFEDIRIYDHVCIHTRFDRLQLIIIIKIFVCKSGLNINKADIMTDIIKCCINSSNRC